MIDFPMNRALLLVSPALIVEMSKRSTRSVEAIDHGLPSDTRCVAVRIESDGRIALLLESASFEVVDGALPVLRAPVFSIRTRAGCPA